MSDRIAALWKRVFGDPDEYIHAFYRSFDNRGNVFCAAERPDGIHITSGPPPEDGEIVGLVNRVPLRLILGDKIYQGYYIYAGCVDPSRRGRGIYRDLMQAAERNTPFTVLIPADKDLFDMYRRLGYTETQDTPFPFDTAKERLGDINTGPFDGDYDELYRLYLMAQGDRFIKDKGFFVFTVSEFAARGKIFYITDTHGSRRGYMIYSENPGEVKNSIKVYDICCPCFKVSDIIDLNKTEIVTPKSMIRGIAESPALNMFGEY
ncbi:MAG: GNAT family N-acetyltransferase [Eubacteriales bacterium]|nr:GNAT family N-acetyltransferase [Eubacteriales bacterium]